MLGALLGCLVLAIDRHRVRTLSNRLYVAWIDLVFIVLIYFRRLLGRGRLHHQLRILSLFRPQLRLLRLFLGLLLMLLWLRLWMIVMILLWLNHDLGWLLLILFNFDENVPPIVNNLHFSHSVYVQSSGLTIQTALLKILLLTGSSQVLFLVFLLDLGHGGVLWLERGSQLVR